MSNLLSRVSSPIVQARGLRGVRVAGPTRHREGPTLDRLLLKTSHPQISPKLVILQLIRRNIKQPRIHGCEGVSARKGVEMRAASWKIPTSTTSSASCTGTATGIFEDGNMSLWNL
ncbi:hypothetical protein MY4824_008644 [Beauveria thailandica]